MDAPTKEPPSAGAGGAATTLGTAAPNPLSESDAALAINGAQAAPTLMPPGAGEGAAAAVEAVTATVWHSDKRVTALWGINQNRNSWMGTNDAGWKKLANNSDTAIVALTILAAHARDTNGRIDYREETSDGMVHEVYVW